MTIQEEFKQELKLLLSKYQVEITLATTTGRRYRDYSIAFYANAIYENGELMHEEINFNGSYFDGESV